MSYNTQNLDPRCTEVLRLLLLDLSALMGREGVPCWLDCGALLGIVRGGDLLPWDEDLDWGFWSEDEALLMAALRKLGGMGLVIETFENRRWPCNYDPFVRVTCYGLPPCVAVWADFFSWHRNPRTGDAHLPGTDGVKQLVIPAHHLSKLNSIKYRNEDVPVPGFTEDYLALCYGEDWRTPNKEFYDQHKLFGQWEQLVAENVTLRATCEVLAAKLNP